MISTSTVASTPSPKAATTAPSKISADFETFLKMLTVQMTNQDPLNPVESADYAVQLATFSGVEQQVQTNDLLKTLAADLKSDGLGTLATWIGKEVPAPGPALYDGTPLTMIANLPDGADQAIAEIRDSNGTLVKRLNVSPNQPQMTWPSSSETTPTGLYEITILSYKDGLPLSRDKASVFQKITEVRDTEKGGVLVLKNGTTVTQSEVTSLRESR